MGHAGTTPLEATTPLAVVVAPTPEQRMHVVGQMTGDAPVLIVSSWGQAQELMAVARDSVEPQPSHMHPQECVGPVADEPAGSTGSAGVRLHEDRRAAGFGTVEVSLTPLEFALMQVLISEVGRVWRFDELVHQVWRTEHIGDVSQVHAVVKRLRAKLTTAHAPLVIEAVRGVGFRAIRPRRA